MEILFKKALEKDIVKIYNIYNNLIDYQAKHTDFTGWRKDVYPTFDTAKSAYEEGSLFVLEKENIILGTVVLNHEQAIQYKSVDWGYKEKSKKEILVVHTLCINPDYLKKGYAGLLMDYIKDYSVKINIKAIRLDVSYNNEPAFRLYIKKNYVDKGKIDLALNRPGFKWWHAMEIII